MTTPAGVSVSLVRLRTRDGVWLDGVIAEPRRRRRRTALIWVHGLGSAFSSGQPLILELSTRLNAAGIAYFKFNNRGHDVVRSEEHTSELQSPCNLVCRLLLEKKKKNMYIHKRL